MSGPGDFASIWEALTIKRTQSDPDLEKDWTSLCAAWMTFQATMERHIAAIHANHTAPTASGSTPAVDPPSAANLWPKMPPLQTTASSPTLAAPSISEVMLRMVPPQQPLPPLSAVSAEPTPNAVPGKPSESQLAAREKYMLDSAQSISVTMTAEVTRISTLYMSGAMGPNQVNGHLATQYNFALGAFQLLRVEASALKELGKPEALRVLDLFVDDTQKALGIVGSMVSQQRAFEMGISKIWQKTMTEITSTQLEINNDTRRAYEAANKNYFSKY